MKNLLSLKQLFICAALITASFHLNAQSFNISWGDKAKLQNDFDDAVTLPDGNTMVLKLKANGGVKVSLFGFGGGGNTTVTPSVMIVNKNMETVKEKEIPIEDKRAVISGLNRYGNNVFLMYTAYDKESKNTSVYALKINETTLDPVSKITLGTFESDSRSDQAAGTYSFSADSSKILLFMEGPERRKENKKFYLGVFDTDLKKQWTKEVELPILEKFVGLYDCDITNEGKVFLSMKHYDQEVTKEAIRKNGSKIPSYTYKLLVFSKDEPKYKEINFNVDNNFIEDTKLIYNKNGTVTVAGLYKKKYNGNLNGVFYASFDGNSSEIKNPKMVQFPADLIRLVDKDNFGSDKEKDPGLYSNFKIRQIMTRSNGSVDLISEFYELDIYTSYNPNTHSSTTYYNYQYGDIVVTNIDKDGKALFTRVPKNQKFTNSTLFLGYYPLIYKDKLVLLYNDDKDNVDRDLEKKPDDVMKFKKSTLVASTINAKGELSRQAIYDNDDEDYITIPTNTTKISDTKYLITSDLIKLFKKRTRFGIMQIK